MVLLAHAVDNKTEGTTSNEDGTQESEINVSCILASLKEPLCGSESLIPCFVGLQRTFSWRLSRNSYLPVCILRPNSKQ